MANEETQNMSPIQKTQTKDNQQPKQDLNQSMLGIKRFQIPFGKNEAMLSWTIQYYLLAFIYFIAFLCLQNGIAPIYMIAFLFLGIPILDEIIQVDLVNPTPEQAIKLTYQDKFKLPLYVAVFVDWMYTIYTVKLLINGNYNLWDQAQMILIAMMFSGSNINVAHELCHKIEGSVCLDYFIGMATIAKNMYCHWPAEHNFGHHKHVATPEDPATSKKGQTVYQFFLQVIPGVYKSSFKIETEKMMKRDKTIKTPYHFKNLFFWFMALNYIIVPFTAYKLGGFWGMFYFCFIGVCSDLFLEIINYIEHYGLQRKKKSDGTYEKVTIIHSWNAPQRISNYFLFKLQRHSDHHENSTKPYQVLLSLDASPQLPTSYPMMILLAIYPKFYFKIMDDILEMYKNSTQGDVTINNRIRKNIQQFLLLVASVFAGLMIINKFLSNF